MLSKKYYFLIILAVLAVSFAPHKAFSADLEVSYPDIKTPNGTISLSSTSELTVYLAYLFYAGISIGLSLVFLTFVFAGIMYFVSPVPGALAIAKDRISGAVSGLLILVLTYLIITTINPQLAIFNLNKLNAVQTEEINTESYGVNFYKSTDCSGTAQTYTSRVADLGDLTNKTNSINIKHDTTQGLYYIAVIYDNKNYWGKCQYINPNKDCVKVTPFAASTSIYNYESSPSGEGVYLYRKSSNSISGKEDNKNGGYVLISNNDISSAVSSSTKKRYLVELSNLNYMISQNGSRTDPDNCTVPKEEMICNKYDKNGVCTEYYCPSVDKKNISSIKISGNYLVILAYTGPEDEGESWWGYCQAYPSDNDVNKEGPQQIKWDAIRSQNSGQNPNYIIIVPITNK